LWLWIIGILLTILITIIAGNYFRSKNQEDTKKIMKTERDKTTQNMVDVANAQEKVRKIGGEVVYRDNKELGADLKDEKNEKLNINEETIPILNSEKKVVSRHTKTFTTDSFLVREESTPDNDSEVKT